MPTLPSAGAGQAAARRRWWRGALCAGAAAAALEVLLHEAASTCYAGGCSLRRSAAAGPSARLRRYALTDRGLEEEEEEEDDDEDWQDWAAAALERDIEESWRVPREEPPGAVQQLADERFISHLRDGGPRAFREGDVPPVEPGWLGETPAATVANVVNALCRHRFGSDVSVASVLEIGHARAFHVILALTDPSILGSNTGGQVRGFSREATDLYEELIRSCESEWGARGIQVYTPGAAKKLRIPDGLWKCEFFPCIVKQKSGLTRYLKLMPGTTNLWRLADCKENYGKSGVLTKEESELRFEIDLKDIRQIKIHLDARSGRRLHAMKKQMKESEASHEKSAAPPNGEVAKSKVQEDAYPKPSEIVATKVSAKSWPSWLKAETKKARTKARPG